MDDINTSTCLLKTNINLRVPLSLIAATITLLYKTYRRTSPEAQQYYLMSMRENWVAISTFMLNIVTSVMAEWVGKVSVKNMMHDELHITIPLQGRHSVGQFVWQIFCVFSVSTMKESSFVNDIYFVTKPLHLVSKLLGLSPWHIDTRHKWHNERNCVYIHASLTAIMVVLILYGMCDSFIHAETYSDPTFNRFVCVLWIIAVTASHSASILALLLNATRNRNHMGNVLSIISRVDSKLLRTNCKHSVYMQQSSRIIRQLMFQFILRRKYVSLFSTLVLWRYMDVLGVICVPGFN
jgi:hypothetical protein